MLFLISLAGLFFIREPVRPAERPQTRPPLAAYFRRLPRLIKDNPTFARLPPS